MHLQLTCENEVTDLQLDEGSITIGGGAADSIRLHGVPYGVVKLTRSGASLEVYASRPLRIGGARFPSRIARLLLPGERLELPNGVTLLRPIDGTASEMRRTVSTAFVAKELLGSDAPAGSLPSKAASLTCVAGPDRGHEFIIAFESSMLGRSGDADIRLRDMAVSRQHARLVLRSGQMHLEPVSNTNGVFINGAQCRVATGLRDGDIVEVGQSVLRFDAGGALGVSELPSVCVEPERVREAVAATEESSVCARAEETTQPELDSRADWLANAAMAISASVLALAVLSAWLMLR